MLIRNTRYQLGNYTLLFDTYKVKIIGLAEHYVRVIMPDHLTYVSESVDWDKVRPIDLTEEILLSIGFTFVTSKEYEHHKMTNYEIRINGKFYYIRGFLVNEEYLWSFLGLTLHYLHQLQNILSIIEPTYNVLLSE
jgi:hypothetical protein